MGIDIKTQLTTMIQDNKTKYYKIVFNYMKNKDDSLDVLYNSIIKAIQNCSKLRNPKYIDTWFCRILINESLYAIKKKDKEFTVDDIENLISVEFNHNMSEYYVPLRKAINKLDDKLKTIIILRYFNEMKIEDIAKVTNSNLSTTKSRLYKALSILKIEMEEIINEEKRNT